MKALTVRQPWASAMFREVGPKTIENRSWPTSYPQVIAIHAGLRPDKGAPPELISSPPEGGFPLGAILGLVEVTGCHAAGSDQCLWHKCSDNPWAHWIQGDKGADAPLYHWELEHPREFVTPIRATGALGLWTPLPTTAHLITIAEVRM